MNISRIFYTILVLIAVSSAYYLFGSKDTDVLQIDPNVELPALSGKNVDNTNYNDDGVRSYHITSSYLDHFAVSGETKFKYPILYIYKEGETKEWEVTADRGILDKNHVLTLYDNVLAKNLLPDASFDTMSTDKLSIQLDNRDFWADNTVLLIGPTFENKGQAMKGNFGQNVATLFNNVQGRYETLTP
ncbi:LPS export ABC transporter periplasmic protein LptC [Vibrio sp. TH_r3]|uniref:LPS export ABC transporter periplasmic protein LptC n=1 Tax=Vibrio sp. TH_r3 TaxID=3082084 RepID=UPI002954FD8B|nr:LPS export ABC transporter periplasmic protein LptC [Vibrio sp. TH_r3]MDV7105938.1 LPS export ABC transporter periplasmic protein LptC [Vibrio sp. TH_r3]